MLFCCFERSSAGDVGWRRWFEGQDRKYEHQVTQQQRDYKMMGHIQSIYEEILANNQTRDAIV